MSSPNINDAQEDIGILAIVLMHDLWQLADRKGLRRSVAYDLLLKELRKLAERKEE